MNPTETLQRFDLFLADQQLELDAVVIGGSALALLGVTSRQTRDCDVLHPALSEEIRQAARRFAEEQRDTNPDWPEHVRATLRELGEELSHGL